MWLVYVLQYLQEQTSFTAETQRAQRKSFTAKTKSSQIKQQLDVVIMPAKEKLDSICITVQMDPGARGMTRIFLEILLFAYFAPLR